MQRGERFAGYAVPPLPLFLLLFGALQKVISLFFFLMKKIILELGKH